MIKAFWRWLFGGHDHKWKIIDQTKISRRHPYSSEWVPYGTRYTLQCEHCGNLKIHVSTGCN